MNSQLKVHSLFDEEKGNGIPSIKADYVTSRQDLNFFFIGEFPTEFELNKVITTFFGKHTLVSMGSDIRAIKGSDEHSFESYCTDILVPQSMSQQKEYKFNFKGNIYDSLKVYTGLISSKKKVMCIEFGHKIGAEVHNQLEFTLLIQEL